MKVKEIKLIVLFTWISLVVLLSILWIVDYSNFGLPELLPFLKLRTYGILIMLFFLGILYLFQRQLLKLNPESSLLKLICYPAAIAFFSLFLYQVIRNCLVLRSSFFEKVQSILLSSSIPAILFTLMAAGYALKAKKIEGIWSRIPFLVLLVLFFLSKKYVHSFDW